MDELRTLESNWSVSGIGSGRRCHPSYVPVKPNDPCKFDEKGEKDGAESVASNETVLPPDHVPVVPTRQGTIDEESGHYSAQLESHL